MSSPQAEAQAERALQNPPPSSTRPAARRRREDDHLPADIGDFAAVNGIYGRFVADPPPARSTFAVGSLPKGGLVEVEAIAVLPAR